MGCFFIGGRTEGSRRLSLDRYIVAIMGAENVGHGMNYAAVGGRTVGGSALTRDIAPRQD